MQDVNLKVTREEMYELEDLLKFNIAELKYKLENERIPIHHHITFFSYADMNTSIRLLEDVLAEIEFEDELLSVSLDEFDWSNDED